MIPPHAPAYPLPPMDEALSLACEMTAHSMQCRYHAQRVEYARQLAEAGLGRPYPAERHAVWPR